MNIRIKRGSRIIADPASSDGVYDSGQSYFNLQLDSVRVDDPGKVPRSHPCLTHIQSAGHIPSNIQGYWQPPRQYDHFHHSDASILA